MTLIVDRGAPSGRRELTNESFCNLSWIIQSPPTVAFLKKKSPMPPFPRKESGGKASCRCCSIARAYSQDISEAGMDAGMNGRIACHRDQAAVILTSSFLSLITTAGTSKKGETGTPLLLPSFRNVHCLDRTRVAVDGLIVIEINAHHCRNSPPLGRRTVEALCQLHGTSYQLLVSNNWT